MAPRKSLPRFSAQLRTLLPGSEKPAAAPAAAETPAPPGARVTVSVIVRRKAPLEDCALHGQTEAHPRPVPCQSWTRSCRGAPRTWLRQRIRTHRAARNSGAGTQNHETYRHRRQPAAGLRSLPDAQGSRRHLLPGSRGWDPSPRGTHRLRRRCPRPRQSPPGPTPLPHRRRNRIHGRTHCAG